MGITRECFGCEKELTENDKIYPQKYNSKESYLCQICNKVWYKYLDRVRAIYAKYDERKQKELETAKTEVFLAYKQQVQTQVVTETPKKIKAENVARQDLQERTEFKAEQVKLMPVASTEDEIDRTGGSFPVDLMDK